MNKEYVDLIRNLDRQSIRRLLRIVGKKEIKIIKKPRLGIVMSKAVDTFGVEFCLGEIVVAEAKVSFKDGYGSAMVIAEDGEIALAVAVVEAVLNSSDTETKKKVEDFLQEERIKRKQEDILEKKLLAKSRVKFDIMVKR